MNEKELLSNYQTTGNLEVLGKLFAPYMSLLYGVCYKYLENQERSNDAVMQIFEELIVKLRIHKVDNFKSWLYVYAKNFCLMQLRKDKRNPHVDIESYWYESEQKLNNSHEDRWEEQDFARLDSCLKSLKEDQEICVRLFYLQQRCYKDISEQTGLEMNKVKSAIQNGKRNLKICLENNGHGK